MIAILIIGIVLILLIGGIQGSYILNTLTLLLVFVIFWTVLFCFMPVHNEKIIMSFPKERILVDKSEDSYVIVEQLDEIPTEVERGSEVWLSINTQLEQECDTIYLDAKRFFACNGSQIMDKLTNLETDNDE